MQIHFFSWNFIFVLLLFMIEVIVKTVRKPTFLYLLSFVRTHSVCVVVMIQIARKLKSELDNLVERIFVACNNYGNRYAIFHLFLIHWILNGARCLCTLCTQV